VPRVSTRKCGLLRLPLTGAEKLRKGAGVSSGPGAVGTSVHGLCATKLNQTLKASAAMTLVAVRIMSRLSYESPSYARFGRLLILDVSSARLLRRKDAENDTTVLNAANSLRRHHLGAGLHPAEALQAGPLLGEDPKSAGTCSPK
jgi:hypothetical protein